MSIRKFLGIVSGKILPKISYPVLRGPLKGCYFVLGSNAGEGGGASVYFNLSEVEQTKSFLNHVKENDIIFDVGANVGYYSLLGSKLVKDTGKVVAIEPVPRNLSYLHRHVEKNRIKNILILPIACSDTEGIAKFQITESPAEGHLIEDKNRNESIGTDMLLVSTIRLDDIAEHLSLIPNIIKIDVEGAELSVLEGAKAILSSYHPTIFLSVHSEELKQNCIKFLNSINYQIEPIGKSFAESMELLAIKSVSIK